MREPDMAASADKGAGRGIVPERQGLVRDAATGHTGGGDQRAVVHPTPLRLLTPW